MVSLLSFIMSNVYRGMVIHGLLFLNRTKEMVSSPLPTQVVGVPGPQDCVLWELFTPIMVFYKCHEIILTYLMMELVWGAACLRS